MRTKIRIKAGLTLLLFNTLMVLNLFAVEPPFVYQVENTGVDCTKPPLPAFENLPEVKPLTDPFEWSDGSGRDTTIEAWTKRRNEIAEEFQEYEIGPKFSKFDTLIASYAGNKLTVKVILNEDTLTLTSNITLPAGTGPFPAVIGLGGWGGTGSLPADLFTSRNIAQIPYDHNQVSVYGAKGPGDPYFQMYPDQINSGQYSVWAWGVSRLIDGLYQVQADLPIDLDHIAVTGCSWAGKLALFSGAFDERIALTIPQESGGGGAAAWRVSETLTGVETLGNTSNVWFMSSMKTQFSGKNTAKLPMDHHELLAMVAPRALLVLGNPSQVWLADTSGYTSCRAAKEVWKNFGIGDRMGFSYVTDHPHCNLPTSQRPEVGAFLDKFLLGMDTINTDDISTHTYPGYDYSLWYEWWGSDKPYFPIRPRIGTEDIWIEAECTTVGARWSVLLDTLASNGSYVTIRPGNNALSKAPTDSASIVYIPFTVSNDTNYYIWARLNCATADDDSYWMKLDDGSFVKIYNFVTDGWEWKKMAGQFLTAGEHTLALAYRKDGAHLDKICVSDFNSPPGEMGETAINVCVPDTTTKEIPTGINVYNANEGFSLGNNYPNPFNGYTSISFEIPRDTYVSIQVYNMYGALIEELAGKEFTAGKHTVEFNGQDLPKGIYFYTLKADSFYASRKMTLQGASK